MSRLEKDLKDWVAHGFVSQDQAKRIRDHEASKPESSWVLSGLLVLGAIIVGIGVISLIAANWNQIPDALKLVGDFVLLMVLAGWTLQTWESKKQIQFEVLLLSFLILCLASIGLISQIYHTGGDLYQALMLWAIISFAAASAARQMFVPFMWTAGFLSGVVFTALDSVALESIFHKNYQAVFMAVPLLCAGFTVVSKRLSGEIGATRAFRYWTLIGGLVALVVAEVHDLWRRDYSSSGLTPYLPGYFLAAFALLGIWQSLEYRKVQKILLILTLGIFLVPFHLPLLDVKSSVAYAAFTIIVLALFSVFLASLQERRMFQWFLSFLGLRFLILYFQALGGLATTGLGLIVSGGLVIGMAIFWNKYRAALAVWAEGWVK